MPNVKISELPELTTPTDSDLLEIVNAGQSKKITRGNLFAILKFLSATKDIDLDILSDNLDAVILRTKGISWTDGVPTSPDENLKSDHIGVSTDIVLENDQHLNPDPNVTAVDNRLISVKNAFAMEVALKQFIEQNYIKPPTADGDYKLHVAGGVATWVTI